jgi:cardiolipin synthase
LSHLQDIPTSSAASAQLLINAEQFYPRLKELIRQAQTNIDIQFYIWRDDEVGREFRDLLTEAATRGVKVRIVLDEVGSFGLHRDHFRPFLEAGGQFSWFESLSPWRGRFFFNLRNHRKLQIIDRQWALIGGMNVGREYEGKAEACGDWQDLQMEVTGPIVARLWDQFEEDWFFATDQRSASRGADPRKEMADDSPCQIIVGGPDSPHDRMEGSVVSLFQYSRRRVWLCTGYFVPNSVLLLAIKMAAWRGVDVRLLVAAKSEIPYLVWAGRSFYPELLGVGVRIYEYSKGINHTKAALLDDDWLFVGSANTDTRSMRLNFEMHLLLKHEGEGKRLETLLEKYFEDSEEMTVKKLQKKPRRFQLLEAACRPLAPIL